MTRAFSPVVALVRRELLTASRQNVLALGLCLIVLLGCSFALAGWPAGDRQLMANLPTSTSVILALLFSLLMAFGQLGTALLACASYFVERDEETLDCLSMAGISSLQLVIGKAIAACAFSVFAGVAVVPIGATVFFMVGVDVATLLGYTALLLVSVFTAASIGIASAAIVRNPYAGALLAMAAVFVQGGWCFFLFVVIGEALNLIPGDVGTLMTPSPYLFPLLSSLALASHAPGSWVAMFSCCLTCCVVSALCLGFASSALARSRSKERAPGAAKVSPHREFSDMRNPVLALESIVGAAQHRRAWLGILGALGVALFVVWWAVLASFLQSGRNASFIEGIVAFFSLQQLLLPVVLIPWSVHLFAKDYRGHALDLLRASALTDSEIFFGKVSYLSRRCASLLLLAALASLPVLLPFDWPQRSYEWTLLWRQLAIVGMGIVTLGVCCCLAAAIACVSAVLVRNVYGAIGLALSGYLVAHVAGVVGTAPLRQSPFVLWVGGPASSPDAWLNLASPILAYFSSADYASSAGISWLIWGVGMLAWAGLTVALLLTGRVIFGLKATNPR